MHAAIPCHHRGSHSKDDLWFDHLHCLVNRFHLHVELTGGLIGSAWGAVAVGE